MAEGYREIEDREWVRFADSLEEEGAQRRDETPLRDAEINMRFLRGDQHAVNRGLPSPYRPEQSSYRFTMNLMAQLMKRKTALITDTRPNIDVVPTDKSKVGAAMVLKEVITGLWEEHSFDQIAARELVRAGTIGSTVGIPMYDESARYGRGDIVFRTYDPRSCVCDPSITRAVDIQRNAEFFMVKEVVPTNFARAAYSGRAEEIQPDDKWSEYGPIPDAGHSTYRSVLSAVARPWRRDRQEVKRSAVPRTELRHTWFRDFQRDANGKALFNRPRFIRYVVDGSRIKLKDEELTYWHRSIPAHILDWDIELEHPWGMPEIGGLRRIQYTLNRLVGQVMENVLTTNKVKMTADTDAVDPKTWDLLAQNPNWMAVRKRLGRSLNIDMPTNAIPQYVMQVIEFLVQAIDLSSGMTEAMQGRSSKGLSGFALEGLQMASQSIVRLEARAFESWLERMFRQVVPLIFQYFTADRVFAYTGPGAGLQTYTYERARLVKRDDEKAMDPEHEWKDFTFRVVPGSSLAMSRVQRGVMATNLFQLGLVEGVDVLRAADWPKPEETYQKAMEAAAARAAMGGGPPGGGRGGKKNLMKAPGTSRRAVPTV
jgi:hypothetical protein